MNQASYLLTFNSSAERFSWRFCFFTLGLCVSYLMLLEEIISTLRCLFLDGFRCRTRGGHILLQQHIQGIHNDHLFVISMMPIFACFILKISPLISTISNSRQSIVVRASNGHAAAASWFRVSLISL
jgi:hypothetical protein